MAIIINLSMCKKKICQIIIKNRHTQVKKDKLLTDIDKKKRQKMNNIVYKKQIKDNVKKWEKRIYMFELR